MEDWDVEYISKRQSADTRSHCLVNLELPLQGKNLGMKSLL